MNRRRKLRLSIDPFEYELIPILRNNSEIPIIEYFKFASGNFSIDWLCFELEFYTD